MIAEIESPIGPVTMFHTKKEASQHVAILRKEGCVAKARKRTIKLGSHIVTMWFVC